MEIRSEIRSRYELLHLLLDREVTLRRLIDTIVDDEANFNMSVSLDDSHRCEGKLHPVTRGFQEKRFLQCNQFCRLKNEPRSQLN